MVNYYYQSLSRLIVLIIGVNRNLDPEKKLEVKLPIDYRIKFDTIKLNYMYFLSGS